MFFLNIIISKFFNIINIFKNCNHLNILQYCLQIFKMYISQYFIIMTTYFPNVIIPTFHRKYFLNRIKSKFHNIGNIFFKCCCFNISRYWIHICKISQYFTILPILFSKWNISKNNPFQNQPLFKTNPFSKYNHLNISQYWLYILKI